MLGEAPRAEDIEAGRLLLRLSRDELAHACGLSASLVLEATRRRSRASAGVRDLVAGTLASLGVRFEGRGLVRVGDRWAPTYEAVGVITGRRLRKARNALGLVPREVASLARVGMGTVLRLEGRGWLRGSATVYAVVWALQRAGYGFGRRARDDRATPGARIERHLEPWEKDIPIEYLGIGLHVNVPEDPDWDED